MSSGWTRPNSIRPPKNERRSQRRVAPEGRDVYSPRFFSALKAPEERNRLTARRAAAFVCQSEVWVVARSYKHLAPLERKVDCCT